MKPNERIKVYENILKPEELSMFMDKNIQYGFAANDGTTYSNWKVNDNTEFQLACQEKWRLQTPDKTLKCGYGHCWDQTELERAWFKKNGYEFKTIFIWFLFENVNSYITHAYLVYKDKDSKWCWFENADHYNRGIHRFDTYEECVINQAIKHIGFNKKCGNKINEEVLTHLRIYEYAQPKYGINMNSFIDNIFNSKDITPRVDVFLQKRH